jgi:hypothetical protein
VPPLALKVTEYDEILPIVCVPPALVLPVKELELVSPILIVVTALIPNVLPRLEIEEDISTVMKK